MKKVCWLLILVLVIGYFVGCQEAPAAQRPIENEDGTLADWMKAEISHLQYEQVGYSSGWFDETGRMMDIYYYGTEDGYVFLFNYGMGQMSSSKRIGEHTFSCVMEFALYAYKDGQFSSVEDLYNEGIISDECLAEIFRAHCSAGNQRLG